VRAARLALIPALLGAGCGSSPPPQPASYQPGQVGTQTYSAPPPAPSAPAPTAPAPTGTQHAGQTGVPPLGAILGDQTTLENIISGALAGSAATMGTFLGGEIVPLQEGIKIRAQTDAKGMKPTGELMSARLGTDDHAQAPVSLVRGRCYTIVGFGGPGVFIYEINLMTSPPLAPQVLAQSGAGGPHPTVGANEKCISHNYPLPMQVQVDMHVARGQGMVAAQVYSK
jgi:hypothetical protein